ncbi:MAG: ATP-binding protein involved in chromosome partitioning [Candidatus Woesearchaeota archaeon]|nr:ATP-binding protein involved in chromosome partitioning [Candidatus Woesearchaeota archaeon]MDN5327568.1 ATP-binding protein involved in chromosome partitioning [Candidatus Woesearchaeota archaeon]
MNKEKFILQTNNPNKIKHILAVLSGKGGVGKTTIAVNLALALAKKGFSVGILDIDISGPNVPLLLGIKDAQLKVDEKDLIIPFEYKDENENIILKVISTDFLLQNKSNAVIWRGPLKHKLISDFINKVNWGSLDYLVVDFPPGTGDETISFSQLISQSIKTDVSAIIVSMPQKLSLADAEKAIDFCNKTNMRIAGIIENMSGIFGKGTVEELAKEYNIKFLGSIELNEEIIKENEESKIKVKPQFLEIAEKIN